MTTLCYRCALRLRRIATYSDSLPNAARAFSTIPARQRQSSIPTFTPTPSTPLLDTLLADLRAKHLIPSALRTPDRRLIFGTKNRQLLADNPRSTQIGSEVIPLQWMDRRSEIPRRATMFNQALEHMVNSEGGEAWKNLAPLLKGMGDCRPGDKRDALSEETLGKVVRKAGMKGQFGTILLCLQQVENTGLSLKYPAVLQNVMRALREHATREGWSVEAVAKSRKWAAQVAGLLEMEAHGGGTYMKGAKDARRRPEVLGVFLELAAVDAFKHKGGKDVDGQVKMYTERLLGCIGDKAQPASLPPSKKGPQLEMLYGLPIYHGLLLAERILQQDLPQPQLARKIREDYEAGLTILADALEARGDGAQGKEMTYGGQALKAWGSVVRD
ncbi:hypothetical protein LTR62_008542 [Meristemomyces frigidus]|uniref:Uncharacterized protein n=1 Tax=Meristemomyces frigidus TaxID=1508187 RepID=A0AAN7TPL7_9PEZI|nr:hypothetical protein LTR62_008542 [Meristemomyces frigidus]